MFLIIDILRFIEFLSPIQSIWFILTVTSRHTPSAAFQHKFKSALQFVSKLMFYFWCFILTQLLRSFILFRRSSEHALSSWLDESVTYSNDKTMHEGLIFQLFKVNHASSLVFSSPNWQINSKLEWCILPCMGSSKGSVMHINEITMLVMTEVSL